MVTWDELERYCLNCRRCKLARGRNHVVIGDGNKEADIMFIGEGPGRQEDLQGLPFVGAAGQLFDKMLASIGLDRTKVYICNVVKCRPPNNRDPEADEKAACLPLLRAQVALVKPKIIVCLGRISGQVVMWPDFRITREHGIWEERKGYWLSATYHPAALLRDPAKKRESWEDLKKLKSKIVELGICFSDDTKSGNYDAFSETENFSGENSDIEDVFHGGSTDKVLIMEDEDLTWTETKNQSGELSEDLPWREEENQSEENLDDLPWATEESQIAEPQQSFSENNLDLTIFSEEK
jgi:uracil-DNA glycosylase family 4